MEKTLKKFTIIVALKNESRHLLPLLESINNLKYPINHFEIIIVDDHSTDGSLDLLNNYKDRFSFTIRIISAGVKKYDAKKGALNSGIDYASNDIILITDADCRPSPDWLSIYSNKFNEGFDFLFAPAPFYQKSNLINIVSSFENLRSSILGSFFTKYLIPYYASARNFGFRKSSFLKIGGYGNTLETLSGDDDLLLREAVKHKMKIGCIDDPKASVLSFSKETLKEYLNQKKRHTKTSLYYLPVIQLLLGSWHILNIFLLISPFIFLGSPIGPFLILLKLTADIIIVKSNENKYSYKFKITSIPALQIIYEFFIVLNFINALFRKDEWK